MQLMQALNLWGPDDEVEYIVVTAAKITVIKPVMILPNGSKSKSELVKQTYDAIRDQCTCVDCGWCKFSDMLEFHHLVPGTQKPGKTRRSRTLQPRRCKTLELMYIELNKGYFLCPTCHKIRHRNPITKRLETYNYDLR